MLHIETYMFQNERNEVFMYPKVVISGSGSFSLLASQLLKKTTFPEWIDIEIIENPMEYLLENDFIPPQKLQSQFEPATIVISGQQSAGILEDKLNNVVIPVKISQLEVFIDLLKDNQINEIPIINYRVPLKNVDDIKSLLNINIKQYTFENRDELHNIFIELRQNGFQKIIGGSFACELAKEYEIESMCFYSEDSLHEALKTAVNFLNIYRKEMKQSAFFKTAVQVNGRGIISLDKTNRITNVSRSAELLLDTNKKNLLNKYIEDCFESITSLKDDFDEESFIFDWNKKKLVAERSAVFVSDDKVGEIIVIDSTKKIEKQELEIRSKSNRRKLQAPYQFADIIGSSKKINEVKKEAYKFSKVKSSVLIQGESGTGKELFAQSIHNESYRSHAPFVAINCATLPENLLDSELFGYVEGAFTGAIKGGKKGLFELADKGTIFLDEISELPFHLQSRLLRVIEEREIMRVGGNEVIPIDVRIIVATNESLINLIAQKKFREDLYYRISVLQLYIPPLRERSEDINSIIKYYLRQAKSYDYTLPLPALNCLYAYHFPGNIRELKNILERFLIYSEGEMLVESNLVNLIKQAINPALIIKDEPQVNDETLNLKENELRLIKKALIKNQNNNDKAAKELGISRTTLWRKLK